MWNRLACAALVSLTFDGSAWAQSLAAKAFHRSAQEGIVNATPVTPVATNTCYPGQRACSNHFVWICRCFTWGCQPYPTAFRC